MVIKSNILVRLELRAEGIVLIPGLVDSAQGKSLNDYFNEWIETIFSVCNSFRQRIDAYSR
jgi:hypothetical protein